MSAQESRDTVARSVGLTFETQNHPAPRLDAAASALVVTSASERLGCRRTGRADLLPRLKL
ncbi:hypothetical protein PF003_g28015 [Phytophthora fragariae]|nr:hypothetical protein PF003_g28015 [Phytophthora fragariae]